MKKNILFIALLTTTLSFAQTTTNPVEYMNQISAEFKLIQSATWDYTKSVAKNKGARAVNSNRLELVQTIKKSLEKVKKIKPFKNETYYRDSVVSFLNVNLAVVSGDYEKIMNMEDIKEQSYDLMDAYLKAQETASDKLSEAGDRVDEVEKRFAKDNNITLLEGGTDKVGLKLKKAGEVYDYYNPVYLIFFKSYKQEVYLMDALIKGDISGMEQNKSTLLKFANEGMTELAKIEGFGKDVTLKNACNEALKFYVEEAGKFQKIIDFYTTKSDFEKAKAKMEAKKEKDRTQADVDSYNKLINEYNKATAEYNKINDELNSKRSKAINGWNNTSENFTSKNIQ